MKTTFNTEKHIRTEQWTVSIFFYSKGQNFGTVVIVIDNDIAVSCKTKVNLTSLYSLG